MKKNNPTPIFALLALLLSFASVAQETPVRGEEEKDSLVVVKPVESKADLNLIIAPEGFEPTDKFNGYLHAQASSGIIMTMIENANYFKIAEGMTDDFFRANKLTLVNKKEFTSDNSVTGVQYKCSFITNDTPFIRYIVFAGDLNKTLWLNITYPSEIETIVEPEIVKSLQTITLKPSRDEK
ncbi:MAG: hypothetical protein P8M19_06130 [Crocinitomicaceae bacterium]|jgi:hypothetical protein|nr:hypothetical protein [Crocinitomicaceae bacterium]MDG1658405.1 hypothetical protein [Crocinitomicaceae bacterium]MDG2441229.1 hypothetical protein [Crocinitomicaceae bacterium]